MQACMTYMYYYHDYGWVAVSFQLPSFVFCSIKQASHKLTTVIQFSSEITTSNYLPVQFHHRLVPAARLLKAHGGRTEERLGLWMSVELDGVDGGDLIADLLKECALDTLVQTDDKDVPLWGIPLPEFVKLVCDRNPTRCRIRVMYKCTYYMNIKKIRAL